MALITATPADLIWVMGVHGGAGETSIAHLHADWVEAGHQWPTLRPARVLLVCRTHARGLEAMAAAIRQHEGREVEGITLLGGVFIADAPGHPPKPLADLVHVLSGAFPRGRAWTVRWSEAWRMATAAAPAQTPADGADRLLRDLTASH